MNYLFIVGSIVNETGLCKNFIIATNSSPKNVSQLQNHLNEYSW